MTRWIGGRPRSTRRSLLPTTLLLAAGLAGCKSSGGGGPSTFNLTVSVSGLTGTGLTVRNDATNVSDTLAIGANGTYTFRTALPQNTSYFVGVVTQPAGQECVAANPSGTAGATFANSVQVTCGPPPLTMLSSVPTNGAIGVSRTRGFTLQFSADLVRTSLTPGSVTLATVLGDQPVTLGGGGAQLVVVPGVTLRNGLRYTLTVAAGVQGAGGTSVRAPISVVFTTEDGAWGAETVVSTGTADALTPKIAADAAGGAVAAWLEAATGPWGARTDGTGAWAFAQTLGGAASATRQQVAVDGAGNGFVVWQQGTVAPFHVFGSRLSIGGGWSSATQLDSRPGSFAGSATDPVLAANEVGRAVAVWAQGVQPPPAQLFAAQYEASGWTLASQLSVNGMPNVGRRVVAVTPGDTTLVVWESDVPFPAGELNYARGTVGSWAPFAQLPMTTGGPLSALRVVVDAAGNAIAAWSDSFNVSASRFSPPFWLLIQGLDQSPNRTVLSDLSGEPLGYAVTVFLDDDGVRRSVFANRYRPPHNDGWVGPELLEASAADASDAVTAIDPGGNVHAAWVQGGAVWVNRYVDAVGWAGAVEIAPGADAPHLAVSATGRAYLVYRAPSVIPPFNRVVKVRQFD